MLDAVRAQFAENFASRGELGASVSIWRDGEEILSLGQGWADRAQTVPWTVDTLVLLWSTTKALGSACVLHALAADNISLESPVATIWPEFGQAHKGAVTLAELLSHRAGLAAMENTEVSVFDHRAVAAALAAQRALPSPHHAYHARTYGYLLDELIRRLRHGQTLGHYWREKFGDPLGLDVWIGLPESDMGRVATTYPAKSTGAKPLDRFYDALADEDSLTRRAFAAPKGLFSVASMNSTEARRASLPSLGGIGTARGLAKFYAHFPPRLSPHATHPLTSGPDGVLIHDTAFSAGFMQDPLDFAGRKKRLLFGPSPRAFGQPGAGGGHAFYDPDNRIAFAYAMNQMELGVMPNEKSLSMVRALYADLP